MLGILDSWAAAAPYNDTSSHGQLSYRSTTVLGLTRPNTGGPWRAKLELPAAPQALAGLPSLARRRHGRSRRAVVSGLSASSTAACRNAEVEALRSRRRRAAPPPPSVGTLSLIHRVRRENRGADKGERTEKET